MPDDACRPTFAIEIPRLYHDRQVRADVVRSKTWNDILQFDSESPGRREPGLKDIVDDNSSRADSDVEDEDEAEAHQGTPHTLFRKKLAKILRPKLMTDFKKVKFGSVPSKKEGIGDGSLRGGGQESSERVIKLTDMSSRYTISAKVAWQKEEDAADCIKAQVKRVLMPFPELVRLRLEEELGVQIEKESRKGDPERAEFHTETWEDESQSIEVTIRFKIVKTDKSDSSNYIVLDHIGVKFELQSDISFDDYGNEEPSKVQAPSGEQYHSAAHFWKDRLLKEIVREGRGKQVADKTIANKIHQLLPSAAAEMVVQTVLEAIEDRGAHVMKFVASSQPSLAKTMTTGLGEITSPFTTAQRVDTDAHGYSAGMSDYKAVPMYVGKPVPEKVSEKLWRLVLGDPKKPQHPRVAQKDSQAQRKRQEVRRELELAETHGYKDSLLNQRRRLKFLKPDGSTKHYEGTLVFFAVRNGVHQDVIDELLEKGADPEVMCSTHPVGTHNSVNRLPALHRAATLEHVQVLLENGADTETMSTLNFFSHCSALWSCCYYKNEEVLDQLLNNDADPNIRGFHVDFPPLCGQLERVTALEMAASMGMQQRLRELQDKGATFKLDLVNTFKTAPAEVVKEMAFIAAEKKPQDLLKQGIVLQTHPSVLKTVYSRVAKCEDAKRQIRDAVDTMQKTHNCKEFIDFIVTLIKNGAEAAGTFLDGIILQTPQVEQPYRNPLPQTAAFIKSDLMNVTYVDHKSWEFDSTNAEHRRSLWQREFIYQGDPQAAHAKGRCTSEKAEFADIKVLNIRGAVNLEIIQAIQSLSYEDQVDLLKDCKSLRAIVIYTWNRWARLVHCIDVGCEIAQLAVITCWWAILPETSSGMLVGQDMGQVLVAILWSIFSGIAITMVVWEIPNLIDRVQDVKSSTDAGAMRLMELCRDFLFRLVKLCLSIWFVFASWNAWAPDQEFDRYRDVMAYYQALNLLAVLASSSRFHFIGERLLPIFNAIMMLDFQTMFAIILWCWLSFFAWCVIKFHGDASIVQLGVESFLSTLVEVGGSTFFDDDPYSTDVWQYIIVLASFLVINVVMMNIFISISGECYTAQKERVHGSLISSKLDVCTIVIKRRRSLLPLISKQCNADANSLLIKSIAASIFLAVVITCVGVAVPAASTHFLPLALMVFTTAIFSQVKLYSILRETKARPPDAKPESKWWIEPCYIWMCLPRDESPGEEQLAVKDPMRLFVVHAGLDPASGPFDGMFVHDGYRNGRPKYIRYVTQAHDMTASLTSEQFKNAGNDPPQIYWNQHKREWRLITRKKNKTTCLFTLAGCSTPYGEGQCKWEPLHAEASGDGPKPRLFVMKSHEFMAFRQLHPADTFAQCRPADEDERSPSNVRAATKERMGSMGVGLGGLAGSAHSPGSRGPPTFTVGSPPRQATEELPDNFGLSEILVRAELSHYKAKANEWMSRERVTMNQMYSDFDAQEELATHLGLSKWERKRLDQAWSQTQDPRTFREPATVRHGPAQPDAAELPETQGFVTIDDSMANVPEAVQKKVRMLNIPDQEIHTLHDLKTVFAQLGMPEPAQEDMQAIFDSAKQLAGHQLTVSGLVTFLYNKTGDSAQELS